MRMRDFFDVRPRLRCGLLAFMLPLVWACCPQIEVLRGVRIQRSFFTLTWIPC